VIETLPYRVDVSRRGRSGRMIRGTSVQGSRSTAEGRFNGEAKRRRIQTGGQKESTPASKFETLQGLQTESRFLRKRKSDKTEGISLPSGKRKEGGRTGPTQKTGGQYAKYGSRRFIESVKVSNASNF